MKKEIWKDVPEYEGLYQVSDWGKVKSLKFQKERILKLSSDDRGYYQCNLQKNGEGKTFKVHKLVAISFLNHIACGMKIVIDHIDNNKKNNMVDNLQLITARQNVSKDKKGYSSKYIGVYWSNAANKWQAQIYIDKKRKYLGLFNNELQASKAYEYALNKIK